MTHDQERFERKFIKTNGCWIWRDHLSPSPNDYGRFKANGVLWKAHRFSYQLYCGLIPQAMCVLHRCDTPSCVNPAHLFLGTQLDNIKDRDVKGRTDRTGKANGGAHYKAVNLSLEQANEICWDRRPQRVIARSYRISQKVVSKIKAGDHWVFRA